jgi:hypothetical protein
MSTWPAGSAIILREIVDGRVRSVRPLRVISDGPDGVAGFLVPDSAVRWPRLADGVTQSQTPDQGWQLSEERWRGPGALFLMPTGAAWAAVLFFDRDHRQPQSWKVDFFEPPRRTHLGLDTLDWSLDLLVALDRATWTVKDRDDLAQQVRLRRLDAAAVAAAHADAERALAAGGTVAGRSWAAWVAWRPDAGWPPLELPAGWDGGVELPPPAAGSSPPLVSGCGARALDAAGEVWIDLDLGGGSLPCGHGHPTVAEAIARQAALGGGPSAAHEVVLALVERLVDRFGRPGDAVAFTTGGAAALDLAQRSLPGAFVVDALAGLAVASGTAPAGDVGPGAWAPGAPLIADERRGLSAAWSGACAAAGIAPTAVVLGEALFAGLPAGAVVAPAACLTRPATPTKLHPILAAAGLATLEVLDGDALTDLAARGAALAASWGTSSIGGVVAVPGTATRIGAIAPGGFRYRLPDGPVAFLAVRSGDPSEG